MTDDLKIGGLPILSLGNKAGMVCTTSQHVIDDLGARDNLSHIATRLFAAMRALDERGVEVILARGFGSAGLGLAIEDRLIRAAGGRMMTITSLVRTLLRIAVDTWFYFG